MQSLLKVSPAAVWNKYRRPRWEYSVNFDVGEEHPGFGHYPDKDDDLGLVFMIFAKILPKINIPTYMTTYASAVDIDSLSTLEPIIETTLSEN